MLVEIATRLETYEAHIARGLLESHDIPAQVLDNHVVGIDWMLANAIGGVKVAVPAEFAERARAILAADYSEHLTEEAFGADEIAACPECSSEMIRAWPWRRRLRALTMVFEPALLLSFFRPRMICDNCQHTWKH